MQEAIFQAIFHTTKPNKILHVRRERIVDIGGEMEKIPALLVRFEGGVYKTYDEAEADLIRKTPAYIKKEVFEITDGDIKAIESAQAKQRQKTIRGPLTSDNIAQEAGVEMGKDPINVSEKSSTTTRCSICGKEFADDLGGNKIRMHKLGAHRKR